MVFTFTVVPRAVGTEMYVEGLSNFIPEKRNEKVMLVF